MNGACADDERWMGEALELARAGVGFTSPNPPVGAVLVKGGSRIGAGYHEKAGEAHAEVRAIADATGRGHSTEGATLYVTLEPCCTHGRTPPCTEAIARAKIARVVVGAADPNPAHAGRGLEVLGSAGVSITTGVCRSEAEELIRGFGSWITRGRPWVIGKIAMSLDGRIVPPEGRKVTGPEAHRCAHEYRLWSDAIIVGAQTVRDDDPALTVRLVPGAERKRQPVRVVMTRSGDVPRDRQVFTDACAGDTMVSGASWEDLLAELGRRGICNALIEGGGRLLASAFDAGVVDEVAFFVAPAIFGGSVLAVGTDQFLKNRVRLEDLKCEKLGVDLLLHGYVHRTH